MTETAILSVSETHRLDALEGVIERGKAAFVEVGEALLEIRDRRLYRESHGTFDRARRLRRRSRRRRGAARGWADPPPPGRSRWWRGTPPRRRYAAIAAGECGEVRLALYVGQVAAYRNVLVLLRDATGVEQ